MNEIFSYDISLGKSIQKLHIIGIPFFVKIKRSIFNSYVPRNKYNILTYEMVCTELSKDR